MGRLHQVIDLCALQASPGMTGNAFSNKILTMAMSNEVNTLYEFANFRFDCIKHRLWRDDELVPLSPKASGLLKLLLERNGEFVPKEDIFADVWAGTFVEDGVLTQNIYVLRKILGKSPSGEQIIENKTRFGYRISVPINVVAATESENVEPSTPSDPPQQIEAPAPRSVGAWARPALIIGGIFLLALPLAFVAYQYFGPTLGSYFRGRQIAIKFTKLTDTGDLTGAVLSPDGKSIAFIRDGSIFLKDILTEKEIKLDIPGHTSVSSLRFSPDGNLLYFRNNKALSTQAAIVRTSRFGGDVETVIDRSWGSFSVSPDGKKIAYILNVPPIAKFNLKVRNLETGEEHDHFTTEQPENICLRCAPAWSPDGTKIVFTILVPPGNGRLIVLDLTSGKTDEIKFKKLRRFEQAAWLPDGSSFLLSASEGSRFFHIWKVSYPSGEVEQVTNGLSSFNRASISNDGKRILAMQTDEISNLFVANANNLSESKQVTFGNQNSYGQNGLHWIDEESILFSIQTEDTLVDNLARLNLADGSKTVLTDEKTASVRVPVSDGKNIWYVSSVDGFPQLFQMDMSGKNVRQLTTSRDGRKSSPRVTSDSRYVYYVVRGPAGGMIKRFDLTANTEEPVFNHPDYQPGPFLELSPDNKFITFLRLMDRPEDTSYEYNAIMTVVSIDDPSKIKTFPVSIVPPIRRFSPDSRYIDWISPVANASQIVRQGPDESKPSVIYKAPGGSIFNFAWSKDGKRLAVAAGQQLCDAVLLSEFD